MLRGKGNIIVSLVAGMLVALPRADIYKACPAGQDAPKIRYSERWCLVRSASSRQRSPGERGSLGFSLRPATCEVGRATGLFAQQSPPANFDELVKAAATARNANRTEEAIELYQRALKLKPEWAEGWWYLGTSLYESDRFIESRDAFGHLLSAEPKLGAGWAMLGLCDYELREYESALRNLQRARGMGLGGNKKLNLLVLYKLSLLLNRYEQPEEASRVLAVLANEEGDKPSLIEALGLSALGLPYLPSELPAEKRDIVLMAGRAAYAATAGRREEADDLYRRLVARSAGAPNAHYSYGVFLLPDNSEAALEQFRRELENSPRHLKARLQIAFEYIRRTQYARAKPYAQQAVELAPKSFMARDALGRVLLELGDTQGAIEQLETGVQLAPDSPEIRYALAQAYARAGRREDAARERAEYTKLEKAPR